MMPGSIAEDPLAGTICDRVLENALKDPDKPFAIVLSNGSIEILTYASLVDQASRYRDWFVERNVKSGDTIAIISAHGTQIFPAFIGAMLVGAIPSVFPTLSAR